MGGQSLGGALLPTTGGARGRARGRQMLGEVGRGRVGAAPLLSARTDAPDPNLEKGHPQRTEADQKGKVAFFRIAKIVRN